MNKPQPQNQPWGISSPDVHHQPQQPQQQITPTTTPSTQAPKPILSIWWPLSTLLAWISFFIASACLLPAYTRSTHCTWTYHADGTIGDRRCEKGNLAAYWAGMVFLVVAAALKLVFWVLIFVRCVQMRRGYRAINRGVDGNGNVNEQSVPLTTQYEGYGHGIGIGSGQMDTAYHSPKQQQQQDQHTSYPSQVYQDHVPLQTRYG